MYIYIYICVCVCVCVCVFWQHFFINVYFIDQYRYVLSTNFCICPFQLPNWFYSIQQELVDETSITNCYLSTFCLILGHHQECVYYKSNVTFACTFLLSKCLLFILMCCWSLMIVQDCAKNIKVTISYGSFINQFPLDTIKWIQQLERTYTKICRQNMSILFNEIIRMCMYSGCTFSGKQVLFNVTDKECLNFSFTFSCFLIKNVHN